ncbi:Transferrin [Eumeta japonica]|uniref:Transferrin n=1 Tax=Eumeta variegata TaxID=151549 RepID=A0A4C1VCB8_EUMVA|nr:Transferrin [Eumeta japonica]
MFGMAQINHPPIPRVSLRQPHLVLLVFESLLTLRSCDPELSMEENTIKALAAFFGSACKAGPWVLDPERDLQLKTKYRSMCAACQTSTCGRRDRYWGGVGALTCLADGVGDVTWAHLDDVLMYYGVSQQGFHGFKKIFKCIEY